MSNSIVELLEAYPIVEEKELPKYKIYCDMDGVLTDFEARFEHFSGMSPKEYESKKGIKAFWHLIDEEVGVKFWSEMGWMPQGLRLWKFISKHNPDILTSPSRDPKSRIGKNEWVKKHITDTPKVIFAYSKNKQNYANENSILIDDKPSNIAEWEQAGGIAIKCKNGDVSTVINKLKELGYE